VVLEPLKGMVRSSILVFLGMKIRKVRSGKSTLCVLHVPLWSLSNDDGEDNTCDDENVPILWPKFSQRHHFFSPVLPANAETTSFHRLSLKKLIVDDSE